MKLTIGETIKNLRREKNITQEELATMLGVTYQSVSRWENGACYPDMELLPELAAFFDVTVDKLIGADKAVEQSEVEEYLVRFQKAISVGKIDQCIEVAREGVKAYPNNYTLLNKLMYALFVSTDETGNISDWEKNKQKYDAEIVALGERIRRFCPDEDIRLEATGRLAFHHCEMGRREIGRAIYDTLPSAEWCRENQIWWGLAPEEKESFLRKKIKDDYVTLSESIWMLAEQDFVENNAAIALYHKKMELDAIVYDGKPPQNKCSTAYVNIQLARRYLRRGDTETALSHLHRAADGAIAFDTRPEKEHLKSLLLGKFTVSRLDFETADTRPHRQIMREKWLAGKDFDPIRETEEFQKILQKLA